MSADTRIQSELDIDVQTFADCRVVTVSGRVDHTNAEQFLQRLESEADAVGEGGGMVLDLKGLDFITSAGLRALMLTHRKLTGDRKLVVAGIDGTVREVFRISKFDIILSVAETAAEAVGAVSSAAAAEYRD